MIDKLRELTLLALEAHGCERLKDFYECGPVQRAAVETFLEAALAQPDAQTAPQQGWKLVPRIPTQEMVDAAKFTVDGRLSVFKWADGYYAMLNAAPTPPAQQDAQKKHKPLFAEMIAQHPGLTEELAQQDAQAVVQDEIVAAWKSGMTVQYFVTIGHDDEWTDYTNPTPPDTSGTRLAWRVKPGQRSNAAPTPPAQQDHRRSGCTAGTDEECVRRDCGAKCPALAQQDAQAVVRQQDLKILMNRLENQAHRAGELWERCQGKSWPEKESAEFAALRDVKMPQTRAALAARLNAAPTPPAQRVMLTPEEIQAIWSDLVRRVPPVDQPTQVFASAVIEAYEKKNGIK